MKKNFLTEQPLGVVITLGILAGWVLSFLLICIIIGGDPKEWINMDEFAFRLILFVSFPMGAIIGSTVVLAYRKSVKDKNKNVEQATKPSVAKDKVTKLKELKELMETGILTQDEFNQQKEKILNEE